MTPERLAELRRLTEFCEWCNNGYNGDCTCVENRYAKPLMAELVAHIDELTAQRDDARAMVVSSGYFQDHRGEDYDLDSDARGDEWRADPVGAVAWDAQVEQR